MSQRAWHRVMHSASESKASLRPRNSATERAVSLLLTLSSAARRKALMFTNFRSYFTIYLSQMVLPPP